MSVIKYCKVQNGVVSKTGVRLSYRKFMQNCVIGKAAVRLGFRRLVQKSSCWQECCALLSWKFAQN